MQDARRSRPLLGSRDLLDPDRSVPTGLMPSGSPNPTARSQDHHSPVSNVTDPRRCGPLSGTDSSQEVAGVLCPYGGQVYARALHERDARARLNWPSCPTDGLWEQGVYYLMGAGLVFRYATLFSSTAFGVTTHLK